MLSRLVARHRHLSLQTLTLISSNQALLSSPLRLPTSRVPLPPPSPALSATLLFRSLRAFSTNGGDDGDWKFTLESDVTDSIFGKEEAGLSGITDGADDTTRSEPPAAAGELELKGGDEWLKESGSGMKGDIFSEIDKEFVAKEEVESGDGEWKTAEGYRPWSFGEDGEKGGDVFNLGETEGIDGIGNAEVDDMEKEKEEEERRKLAEREQELTTTLKGPNRAFGDLISASGITEDMIDSLILLKDVRGVKGLPPLSEIEDKAIARMNATSSRAEIERKKQEEIAKARVREVDEKGRAYGTGRRKCSIARVWIQPGDGTFIVNDKQFDVYFPILDHRAELLRPFTETKTLGLWDVNCTVKGGGVSGQVGAIRLGISRALQNWEPGLRPYLKAAGYLRRDPRVVERKKPGKAKARKSFQWVKR
ncbi:30S ribosomal protein S9, mitochondrial [Dioscorea cayenensis subsp. rotundata]|uniref:30S ribosomal protein S9, mitochondrial n=1 Tax=Dioscorea cayennensis subsp. rotundata TaxID=55577 RepID=A0AB40AW61_DIOCR|nr:30S ribosomal protein S9, mitochondrial [Dioscorea cayenensis subsp. rotundata]